MAYGSAADPDGRREGRDEVHYRARAACADGRTLQLLVVNISPHGFMARCEADVGEGDRLAVTLPCVGAVPADVRWALGGRIGCELASPLGLASYYELLATITR